jgi:hypothetical protein
VSEGLRIDPANPGRKFETDCCQLRAPLKTLLTDDKDAVWDCDRAQMTARAEGMGGESVDTRVRIEKDALKFFVAMKTAIGDN